jgi:uncharacterized protein (DUF1697 family)
MPAYVALLRAVNVGGTGKLPMAELVAMGQAAGFAQVKTYIASGNMIFTSPDDEATVKAALEAKLHAYAGKAVGVMIRTAAQMAAVLAANPFPDEAPNRTVAIFLDAPPPEDLMAGVSHQRDERIAAGVREVYVAYPGGMADTKLRIKAAAEGTARNLNTVGKLVGMAGAL